MDMDQTPEKNTSAGNNKTTGKINASLRERLITSGVGLTLIAIWLIFFDTIALNIVVALLGAYLLFEMLSATHTINNIFVLVLSYAYALTVPFLVYPARGLDLSVALKFATFAYLLCILVVYLIRHQTMHFEDVSFATFATVLIPLSLSYAIRLRECFPEDGLFFFLLALGGAWLTDTAAYFVGITFGKHKLCPEISPKKTTEGFFGGIAGNIVLCIVLVAVYALILKLKGASFTVSIWQVAVFGFCSSLIAVVGDLSASMIKRQCGTKDYGNILPGMGGGMDRFDSVLLVLPFTFFFLQVFPIIARV